MALQSPQLRTYYGQLTKAQVNAGKIVVPGSPGRIITVVDAWVRAIGGACTANTSIDITGSVSTTIVSVFTQAGLTQNTVLRAGTTTTGVSTNLNTALTQGDGLKVANVGTAADTLTALDVCIHYVVASAHA